MALEKIDISQLSEAQKRLLVESFLIAPRGEGLEEAGDGVLESRTGLSSQEVYRTSLTPPIHDEFVRDSDGWTVLMASGREAAQELIDEGWGQLDRKVLSAGEEEFLLASLRLLKEVGSIGATISTLEVGGNCHLLDNDGTKTAKSLERLGLLWRQSSDLMRLRPAGIRMAEGIESSRTIAAYFPTIDPKGSAAAQRVLRDKAVRLLRAIYRVLPANPRAAFGTDRVRDIVDADTQTDEVWQALAETGLIQLAGGRVSKTAAGIDVARRVEREAGMRHPSKLFISYSSKDAAVVQRIAISLRGLGHDVWLDKWRIKVGQSITSEIERAIGASEFLVVALSKHSIASGWVEREWKAKHWQQVVDEKRYVLPILLEACDVPLLLKDVKYADFSRSFDDGLVELLEGLEPD